VGMVFKLKSGEYLPTHSSQRALTRYVVAALKKRCSTRIGRTYTIDGGITAQREGVDKDKQRRRTGLKMRRLM
jgi:hypothetical protein